MMRLLNFRVEGFRPLANIEIPLCDYTILIGRNNSGKSAVLSALKLLLEGTTRDLKEDDFHAQQEQRSDHIVFEAILDGVSEYLPLCNEKHRTKIADCVIDDTLRIRRMGSRSPLEFGKLELWQPARGDFGLPTGIESALKQLLPEVILIEAFKDPTEEAQAKSSATFGKLLKQIVEQVSAKLESEVQNTLDQAARKFNVIEAEGEVLDERPEELRRVEQRIRQHIQTVFEEADVRLRFRLPEVSDLMGSATVELKDRGPWTTLEGKGQGFQRALYLALLQALAEELRATEGDIHRPFLLLFEEPEAFLHPALQREMGDILENISQSNQVIIATHSPLLVTSQRILNVVILRQVPSFDTKLYATCCLVPDPDLLPDPDNKHLVSLLKFSSSAEFLFADCVLVVEGPSDRALLEASWSALEKSLRPKGQPLSLAVVEAGSKAVVPVWTRYLRAMGFSTQGLVDLDFLWDGAGRCLGSDPDLSQFAAEFWRLTEENGVSEVIDGSHRIPTSKKTDAFSLILQDLGQKAQALRQRLQSESGIWVLGEGEMETYFGLTRSSKGHYATVSQRVRNGEMQVHPEIETVLRWAVSPGSQGEGAG